MFYDKFVSLCADKGVSPSRAAVEAGISKSLVTKWRTHKIKDPSADVARKVASYFGISVAELLGDDEKKENPSEITLTGVDKEIFDSLSLFSEDHKRSFLLMMQSFRSLPEDKLESALETFEAFLKMLQTP